jgi:hypothetical protein
MFVFVMRKNRDQQSCQCKTDGHDMLAFGDGIVGVRWAAGRRRDPKGFAAGSAIQFLIDFLIFNAFKIISEKIN